MGSLAHREKRKFLYKGTTNCSVEKSKTLGSQIEKKDAGPRKSAGASFKKRPRFDRGRKKDDLSPSAEAHAKVVRDSPTRTKKKIWLGRKWRLRLSARNRGRKGWSERQAGRATPHRRGGNGTKAPPAEGRKKAVYFFSQPGLASRSRRLRGERGVFRKLADRRGESQHEWRDRRPRGRMRK